MQAPEISQRDLAREPGDCADNCLPASAVPAEQKIGHLLPSAGGFHHSRYASSTDITVAAHAPGHLLIARVMDGRFHRDTNGVSERFGPGDVFVVSQPHQSFTYRAAEVHLDLIGIGLAVVAGITGDPSMSVPGRLQLLGYQPVSPAVARSWNRTADFATHQLANQDPSVSPLVIATTAALLAASSLVTFPNNAVSDPDLMEHREAHPRTVQQAAAFIDAHAAENITVADIAAAAFVTPRAVQLAFRRHLDTTPLEYLRRVRLERAHTDLTAANPAHTTVTAIAYRWGFPSPSRFAAAYRHAYGTTPGKSLAAQLPPSSATLPGYGDAA